MLYKLYSHTNLSILDHMMTLKILLSARFQNVLISSIWAIYVVQEVEAHQVLKMMNTGKEIICGSPRKMLHL